MTKNTYVDIHTHRPQADAICPSQAGVHPWLAASEPIDMQAMRQAEMIGEIGLDYASEVDRSVQEQVFREQLDIAERLHKPVVLHCVRAFEQTMSILKEYDLPGVVFHGFIGSPEQAAAAVEHGYYLSFGQRTFRSPKSMRALRLTPGERLFCETDDDPVSIEYIYRLVARQRETTLEQLAAQIINNYEKLFCRDE